MEFAVFSDVHGNIYALKEMLRRAEEYGINNFIFCGDVVGYFLHQEEVIDGMRQLPNLYAVKGNHDDYYLRALDDRDAREYYVRKYGKSYCYRLPVEAEKYLEGLPDSLQNCTEGKKILIVHGSKEHPLEGRIYPDTEVSGKMYEDYDFVFLGHTHYRMCRRIGNTILINPGSLGQPRDKGGYGFCIVNTETEDCRFIAVSLEQEILLEELLENQENPDLIRYLKGKMEAVR